MSEPAPLHMHPSALRPNWRLKAAREQCGLSQQELAGRLNLTPNSVSRWERGISSPGPYFRRQLCDLLGKSAEELGLLAGRSAAGSKSTAQSSQTARASALPIWNVPLQRNPFFTGRERELLWLRERLQTEDKRAHVPQALCGLAGVGKTQVAVEYCYRFYETYRAVLWVRADPHETLVADLVSVAALLHLPERDRLDQQRVAEAVKGWLRSQHEWLLILDNIEDLTLIQEIVPSIYRGHVLLTMQTQITGTLAQSINLSKMEEQESVLFLLRRVKRLSLDARLSDATPGDYADALAIAHLLDGLPLALDQAGAYIEETACSFADYIDRYRSQRATLLQLRGTIVVDHLASVVTMFSLIIEQIEALNPAALALLRLCAFLQPDAIPESLIIEGVAPNCYILEQLTHDPCAFDVAIKTLRDFSLVQRHAESKTFSLHRLMQAVIQDLPDEPERRQRVEWTVELVSRAFPDSSEEENWPRCQLYLPQAQECAALIEQWGIVTHEAVALLLRAGTYLLKRGQYAQAEELLPRAVALREKLSGPEHPGYAESLATLALLREQQGDDDRAIQLYRQALNICEGRSGPDHPLMSTWQAAHARLLAKMPELSPPALSSPMLARQSAPETETQPSPGSAEKAARLDDFLASCCELHPRAWCRVSDLWSAYQHWVESQREPLLLSHHAFAQALKKHGFCPGRTNAYRTWRGIALRTDLSDGE